MRPINTAFPRLAAVPILGPVLVSLAILVAVSLRLLIVLSRTDVAHVFVVEAFPAFLPSALAVAIGRLWRRRVVLTYAAGNAAAFMARRGRLALPVLRRLDAINVPTRGEAEAFQQFGLTPHVVPDIFERDRFPAPHDGVRPPLLLWMGDLTHETNPSMAIRALARLRLTVPEARLLMVGQGPLLGTVRALAFELDVAEVVSRKPWLPDHRLRLVLQTACGFWQTAPASLISQDLLAAVASGAAVVGVEAGSLPELLDDGVDGLLVPPHDYLAMAAATAQVLRRRVLARGLAENAQLAIRRHDWARVRSGLAALYGVVLAESPEPGEVVRQVTGEPVEAGKPGWIEPDLAQRTEFLWSDSEPSRPVEKP